MVRVHPSPHKRSETNGLRINRIQPVEIPRLVHRGCPVAVLGYLAVRCRHRPQIINLTTTIMKQYIDKSAVVAEIEKLKGQLLRGACSSQISMQTYCKEEAYDEVLSFLDTLEVKEVNIAEMADEYYDALMEEASVWMDEGTMGHCRLAYYTGCKDVLNKIRKGE